MPFSYQSMGRIRNFLLYSRALPEVTAQSVLEFIAASYSACCRHYLQRLHVCETKVDFYKENGLQTCWWCSRSQIVTSWNDPLPPPASNLYLSLQSPCELQQKLRILQLLSKICSHEFSSNCLLQVIKLIMYQCQYINRLNK